MLGDNIQKNPGGCFLEFCSSCKSLMVPQNSENRKVLVCSLCGHRVEKFNVGKYRIKEDVNRGRKDILIIEEGKRKTTEEQRKYLTDLYGNEAYEASEE